MPVSSATARPAAGRLLLYAPNVHTGGGLVLLQSLLAAWPPDEPLTAWLDARACAQLRLPDSSVVHWVAATPASRLGAEISLARSARRADLALCFHGLPPLLPSHGKALVFVQNRIYLGQTPLSTFGWRTRQRLRFELAVARLLRRRVHSYWVQTPSMAHALRQWYGSESVRVHVLAFAPAAPEPPAAAGADSAGRAWDFVYVADGEAHKNHRRLIEAWILLSRQGLRPSLALTLSPRDQALASWIEARSRDHGLRVTNLGTMTHEALLQLYGQASALVFPSLAESFGLPLVEARAQRLPILAGELDFVRDVCEPAETFDPASAMSIARAVRRFLRQAESVPSPADAQAFLRALRGSCE